tara:strand:- start:2889 stop:3686 length:798 start_codon:yes stop_codon:yes gene_type:complete
MPVESENINILSTIQTFLRSLTAEQQADLSIGQDEINQGVNAISAAVTTADDEAEQILLRQNEMKGIVDAENERIQKNIKTTETNLLTKNRKMKFIDNKRQRAEQYNKILYVFIITLSLIIIAIIGFQYLPFLPDVILQIFIVIVGSFGLVKIFNIYRNLQSRSHLDYNQLKLDGPKILSPEEVAKKQQAAAKSGDLLRSIDIGGCRAAECCDTEKDVIWSESSRKCIPKPTTAETEEFTVERMKYNRGIAQPNSPNETLLYSKV